MIRSFLTVSTGTLTSRLLGFARDAMLAALLGAGPVADAFLVAFQLVNVARRLLAEGALNAALVPAWLRVREAEGSLAAAAFAGRVLGTVSAALIVATGVAGLLMPLVIAALAPGFAGKETLQLAVDNARLMLPYLAFAGPATVMMALLNAQGRFALTAFSPLLFNTALIFVIGVLLLRNEDAVQAALVIAATVGAAGFLQLLVLVLRSGDGSIAGRLRISFDGEMRGFLARAAPGMIAGSGPQLLVVAGTIIASTSPSAVSWLYFANRLIELPLGIVGVAMGSVLVPELTRAARADDRMMMMRSESRGLELALGLALPATLGLIALSKPIVRMLFEHGVFTSTDTLGTSHALVFLALGLPAQVLTKALSPAYFAREDTATPLLATLTGLVVAVALAAVLGHFFGVGGIAASLALGAWTTALSLLWRGAATFGFALDEAARRRLPRIVTAGLAMGALLWLAVPFVLQPDSDAHGFSLVVPVAALISGGLAVYGLLLVALGVIRWGEVVNAFRQTTSPTLRD
jgi:putative peptidoglycan lipid II flippase